ncbi:MAG: ATP-binding protein [Nanoarchaeota archaeon]|nr:MAG: ATP-binding protein [Nanoarchaeota archaeon]
MESPQRLVASWEIPPSQLRQITNDLFANIEVEWRRIRDIKGIELCIEEAIYNVKNHTPTGEASVELLIDDQGIIVRITDQGPGFDYGQALESIAAGRVFSTKDDDGKTIRGNGLLAILGNADKVEFNTSGNSISIYFNYMD